MFLSYFRSKHFTGQWGNPRRWLLVHSVLTLAFLCLLQIDEVLSLQFQDLQYCSPDHIMVTLHSRKTHPFGGEAIYPSTRMQLTWFIESKSYDLWILKKEDRKLCMVSAISSWIRASSLSGNPTGYCYDLSLVMDTSIILSPLSQLFPFLVISLYDLSTTCLF